MSKVELYVYDLSRGMAKSMSLMLTGKQIDGIWHTSVVAYGREVFFGQGIMEAKPGATHHGAPLYKIDMGETSIDEETFQEYLTSLQELYTPAAYHLIEFNCNHFTADVVGFLTGREIPNWISGLPAEFLSTPFGQAMRPQIDAMFRRTSPNEHSATANAPAAAAFPTPPPSGSSTPGGALLNSVVGAATAQAGTSSQSQAEVSPLALVSSTANFTSIIRDHPAVVVNFTNTPTCPPCRTIKPVYEAIAAEHASAYGARGVRFVEVELGIGEGRDIASQFGVSATPTFIFFRNGKKVDEMKGADKRGLEARVEAFLEETWPRHSHRKVYLAACEAIPLKAITSSNIPAYPALVGKLETFGASKEHVALLKDRVVPVLEGKAELSESVMQTWVEATEALLGNLKPEQTFPVIDLWRVGLLQPRVSSFLATQLSPTTSHPITPLPSILSLGATTLSSQSTSTPKPFLLTLLRLLTNVLAPLPLANVVLSTPPPELLTIVVDSLLHPDVGVRSAAAGVALNMAMWRHRVAKSLGSAPEDADSEEWSTEIVSAVLEAIAREDDEDVAHRLLAALGLTIWLSPGYTDSVQPLLEVLSAKSTIEGKIKGWKKAEVKKLAIEIASKMC
ncbi:PPPDE putative peptidase domain-domain-containing protein [Naematelia encephala]|uniref:PPPDE putative peptidase domain-domain-containing protein n=1 Tax=Naematelia encephala TaxID=71784 RepID=A0A1Y2ARI9_9TREE|nr:PPPDE putative peptidase domain-domain-containing protein [Naematelia encephala]